MENHVENFIVIENLDNKVKKEVERIFEGKDRVMDLDIIFRLMPDLLREEVEQFWIVENCGSPSFHGSILNKSNDRIVILITSIANPINDFLALMFDELYKLNNDIIIHNTFEDDAVTMAGVYYISNEYEECRWLDIENWDCARIHEDEDYKSYFHEVLDKELVNHKNNHREILEEIKEENEQNSEL